MKIELKATPKQIQFINSREDEVLFGGAAGGGKSMGQMLDALVYAMKYKNSRQLILRRTLPELEKTLIRTANLIYPRGIYTYKAASHVGEFINGSVLEFGYCDSEEDVHRYQSAEYDIIRFDELTHFTEYMYLYLYSRLRGSNGYPKQIKSTTNPGGPGHYFVKSRFVDLGPPNQTLSAPTGTRRFIPALVSDNSFLTEADPEYIKRLQNLPDSERRALLYGEWELFEGRFFTEWNEGLHVVPDFEPPPEWPRYISIDYGLDMFAACFFACEGERVYLYKELYQSGLIISQAAALLLQSIDVAPEVIFAPPDLWNRRQDSGVSAAEIFMKNGAALTRASAARESGWLAVKELLTPMGQPPEPRMRVCQSCRNIIRCMGAIMHSRRNPNDAANDPHELTHAPDALRYFAASRRGNQTVTRDSELERLLCFGI